MKLPGLRLPIMLALLAFCALHPAFSTACAQGTAFTYQGQLNDSGGPANGNYDFTFALFNNSSTNTGQVGITLTNLDVGVTNGLFNVVLDFGANFPGASRWLALGVRTNGSVTFTGLSPLQELFPTPYAIFAANAGSATSSATATTANNLSGSLAGNVTGTQSATVVATVGGQTAANVASGASAANAATSGNTASTIVKRDGTGSFSAGTITATNFTGNGSGLTNLNIVATVPSAINENTITIGATNVIAPLSVAPKLPSTAIGSTSTGAQPTCIAVAGRYAYVVDTSTVSGEFGNVGQLQIFDVSTPSAPIKVGSVVTAGNTFGPTSVAVAGRYAYVANISGPSSLEIFDVSTPSAPVSVGLIPSEDEPKSIAVAGCYVYVANSYPLPNALEIFDVTTPLAPVSIGSAGTGAGEAVAVAGRYAYLVNSDSSTLQIFDVSNPSGPVSVGSAGTSGVPTSLAVAGRYAYVVGGTNLQIFDVSNPFTPASVGSVSTVSGPTSIAVAGRYACVAGGANLQIFDVSNPSAPASVGSVSTGSGPTSVAVSGRYAYVVNSGPGTLQIFDLGGSYIQQLEAGAMETGTLQTRDTVTVGNNLDVRGGMTVSASTKIAGSLGVNGSVGIGISAPAYTLQVNGSVAGVGAYNNVSDARYKTNITRLTHALDKIMALRGVEYDWRSNAFPQVKFDSGPQLGFVAQEIKEVLPEVVSQDAHGYYSIAYSKVIPVLVEAIKDQQKEMENRQEMTDKELTQKSAEIEALKQSVEELKKRMQSLDQKK